MNETIQGSTARVEVRENWAAKRYPENSCNENFERECVVYRRLGEHPNIAILRQIHNRTLYLEAGECLRNVLRNPQNSRRQKNQWIIELGEGLRYIHSKGVIHSDLRAANAIISNQGSAKWIDFGSSGIDSQPALDSYDEYGYKPQDPSSPPTSIKTDLFAYGCTIFEIETGARPFYHETKHLSVDETLTFVENKYRQNEFPSTKSLYYREIIEACWHGDYESMDVLMADLRQTVSRHTAREQKCPEVL